MDAARPQFTAEELVWVDCCTASMSGRCGGRTIHPFSSMIEKLPTVAVGSAQCCITSVAAVKGIEVRCVTAVLRTSVHS